MIELILGVVVFLLFVILYSLIRSNMGLRTKIREIASSKQSLATKYGKMSEQFMPFMKDYPYNPENFRFLGTPVDGVQFEDDKVVFVEFKTSGSKLSEKQKNIREMIKKKNVDWDEVRIE
ncbi:MAG: Holliday junction resolvase-like protein [Candidatus Aenigmatarchaeota archaeon]|nr:endonuclease [Nanoarchaeota archaeon]